MAAINSEITKTVVCVAAGYGVQKIVSGVVHTLVPQPKNMVGRVGIYVGALAISGVITNETNKYVRESLDEIANTVESLRELTQQMSHVDAE